MDWTDEKIEVTNSHDYSLLQLVDGTVVSNLSFFFCVTCIMTTRRVVCLATRPWNIGLLATTPSNATLETQRRIWNTRNLSFRAFYCIPPTVAKRRNPATIHRTLSIIYVTFWTVDYNL